MSEWVIKQGNTDIQEIEIRDKNGNVIQDLADVQEAKFQVKDSKDIKISKSKEEGLKLNTPSTGHVQIIVLPADTINLPIKRYVMGLELIWSEEKKHEVYLYIDGIETNRFRIAKNMVD